MSEGDVKIRLTDVGKRYQRVHERPMLLREALLFLAGRSRRIEDFWALRHLSFEVFRGETMGIVGRNGSGKSTLLQLVAGSTFCTEGVVSTRGRVSTLLALGAGMNGDMTGEENIILNAGFIGLSLEETRRRMPQIVEFAELQDVIDTPVRFYSSGMQARLGFALAINVSADIIVIDEVLGVGDSRFQRKCMREINRLKEEGRTILYATQSAAAVADFCTRAVWLDSGQVRMQGKARDVASEYAIFMDSPD